MSREFNKRVYSRIERNKILYRILLGIKRILVLNKWYNFAITSILFLFPFYPTFASIVYSNNQYDFLRSDIDETSIIWSYYSDEVDGWNGEDSPILENVDSYLSIKTILNDERDLDWTNEIVDYEIKSWDNISSIAYKFKVSNNSIYWANNFSKDHIIHPGDVIKVPPTSWLIHQVKKWETISSLSKLYSVDSEKIYAQNLITIDDTINVWDVLVIPWAIKKVEVPVYKKVSKKLAAKSNKKWASGYSNTNSAKSAQNEYVNAWWKYRLVRRQPAHSFYWWNCTRYVSQYKNVKWWWDAKDWLPNAAANWYKTWSSPAIGSIIVFNWRWYNPRYGHVWIVMDINWDDLIISDMNYRRLNEVTYRKIDINERAIIWYIYVE